ncbi:hypothetical protein ZWY2020_035104 [Hordeum vulgare]|nr:hypothetical protein ZWY2020_035104 [Hordeum vulgare]
MFRLTLLRRAIALCLFFHAIEIRGIELSSTTQEEPTSFAQASAYGQVKQNYISMKSTIIVAAASGQDSGSWDQTYFAVHETSSGGPNDNYYGLQATTGVYGHKLKPRQLTSTFITVTHSGDGVKSSFNAIQVGWHIHPENYGDSRPHFYTYWTRDGYDATGCFNMNCPGFIRASGALVAPGDVIKSNSGVHEPVQNITLKVLKDKTSGDWWVYYGFNGNPMGVGYFPRSLFTYLAQKANGMAFGAFVIADKTLPTPPMGSDAHPNGGQGRAASFTNLRFIDQDGRSNPMTTDWPKLVTSNKCHSITPIDRAGCLYGGPGGCVR